MTAKYTKNSRHTLKRNVEAELDEEVGLIPAGKRVYRERTWLTIISHNEDGTYTVLFDKDKGASPDALLLYPVSEEALDYWLSSD